MLAKNIHIHGYFPEIISLWNFQPPSLGRDGYITSIVTFLNIIIKMKKPSSLILFEGFYARVNKSKNLKFVETCLKLEEFVILLYNVLRF